MFGWLVVVVWFCLIKLIGGRLDPPSRDGGSGEFEFYVWLIFVGMRGFLGEKI
jgi:hypothetical protein